MALYFVRYSFKNIWTEELAKNKPWLTAVRQTIYQSKTILSIEGDVTLEELEKIIAETKNVDSVDIILMSRI